MRPRSLEASGKIRVLGQHQREGGWDAIIASNVDGMIPGTIARALQRAGTGRCLLIAHPDVGFLAQVAEQTIAVANGSQLPIGEPLARALLAVSPRFRPQRTQRWLVDKVATFAPGPVVCTEIDLLFAPDLDPERALGLDPLALFRAASRSTPVIVAWPGSFIDGVLAYAVPEHAHYRAWRDPDVEILQL